MRDFCFSKHVVFVQIAQKFVNDGQYSSLIYRSTKSLSLVRYDGVSTSSIYLVDQKETMRRAKDQRFFETQFKPLAVKLKTLPITLSMAPNTGATFLPTSARAFANFFVPRAPAFTDRRTSGNHDRRNNSGCRNGNGRQGQKVFLGPF